MLCSGTTVGTGWVRGKDRRELGQRGANGDKYCTRISPFT